jgi:hypothetical protein
MMKELEDEAERGMSKKLKRRAFLGQLSGAAAATLAAGTVGASLFSDSVPSSDNLSGMTTNETRARRWQAYQRRYAAALVHRNDPLPSFPINGDEERYPNRLASFTKGLPHNDKGEVDVPAYTALLHALSSGQTAAFEAIPLEHFLFK